MVAATNSSPPKPHVPSSNFHVVATSPPQCIDMWPPWGTVLIVSSGWVVASSCAFLVTTDLTGRPRECHQCHRHNLWGKKTDAEDVATSPSDRELHGMNTTTDLDLVMGDLSQFFSQVSYLYLQKELGLSEETMLKITFDAPSALGMTTNNIRSKVEVLRSAMDLSDEDIEVILNRQPTLLQLSATNNLAPTLEWIQCALELSKTELRQLIVAQPRLVTCSVESNLQHKLKFFTGLGFSIEECRKLVLEEPNLFLAGLKNGLVPRARFFLGELELSKERLRLAVRKNPKILLYSLEDNLAPKLINYAIMTLHMDAATHVAKLVTSYPKFLDYNLERHILPITRYFLTELDITAHEFGNILLKFPRLMTYSLSKIKHVVGFLRYQIGFDADGVRRVLYQAPQVLGLNTEQNLAPKVEFLKQSLLGCSLGNDDEDDSDERREKGMQVVRRVIMGMPTVLNLSVEKNLAPKLEYLRAMLQPELRSSSNSGETKDLQQLLQETLLRMPALLGYSLDKRIRPRMERIVDAGLPPSNIAIGISMTEPNFQKWLVGREQGKAKKAIVLLKSKPSTMQQRQLPMPPVAREGQADDRSGRIVHWTGERKPWRS